MKSAKVPCFVPSVFMGASINNGPVFCLSPESHFYTTFLSLGIEECKASVNFSLYALSLMFFLSNRKFLCAMPIESKSVKKSSNLSKKFSDLY